MNGFLGDGVADLTDVRLEGVGLVDSAVVRRTDVRAVVVVDTDVVDTPDDNLCLGVVPLLVPTVLVLTLETVDPPDAFLERVADVGVSEGAVLNVASLIALDKLEFGREVDGIRSVDFGAEERIVETRERTEGAIDFGFGEEVMSLLSMGFVPFGVGLVFPVRVEGCTTISVAFDRTDVILCESGVSFESGRTSLDLGVVGTRGDERPMVRTLAADEVAVASRPCLWGPLILRLSTDARSECTLSVSDSASATAEDLRRAVRLGLEG